MGGPIGNKHALGNDGGRPGRTKEEIQKLCDAIITWANKEDSLTLEDFAANVMEVDRATLNIWAERYEEFRKAFRRTKAILANKWIKGGLKSKLNPGMVNNFYYQLSDEHKSWLRELKNKDKEAQEIHVHVPSFDKKEESK